MKKEMFAVRIITRDGMEDFELADFGEMAADTARRVFQKKYGKEAHNVVSLEKIDRLKVEEINQKFRENWPLGAKTIPVFYFKVE